MNKNFLKHNSNSSPSNLKLRSGKRIYSNPPELVIVPPITQVEQDLQASCENGSQTDFDSYQEKYPLHSMLEDIGLSMYIPVFKKEKLDIETLVYTLIFFMIKYHYSLIINVARITKN